MPAPAQFRAARAMLDWSLVQLSRQARVSVSAALTVEGRGRGRKVDGVGDAIRAVYEAAGVRFVGADGSGAGVMLGPSRTDADGASSRALPATSPGRDAAG